MGGKSFLGCVVLHPLSTSNHNIDRINQYTTNVVLHPLSTSNHNNPNATNVLSTVVLHPLSTSNHNAPALETLAVEVVLHPLSTSNHNGTGSGKSHSGLYCILFLHQTTTISAHSKVPRCCIASSFYIKPQRSLAARTDRRCCIASSFYIKPQPRTPDTLIFRHLTASRHDTKRGGVHRGSRFDAVFTFSTNIRKIIFTEIRRCMSVQRAGARLRSDSSEANI